MSVAQVLPKVKVGDPDYDPTYSLDGNGVVDIVDIMLIVKHRGETYE